MAERLIRLRYPAACSGCGAALAPKSSAWWDSDAKTTRCEECGAGPAASGTPPASAVPAEVRRGIAGGSAMRMADDKRAMREADVRAAHPRIGGFLLAVTEEPQDIKNWEKGAVGERKLGAGLDGLASTVRLFVGWRDCMKLVQAMPKQVGAVRDALGKDWTEVQIRPMLCFVDAGWQSFAKPFELDGVLVTWPRAARERISSPGPLPSETIDLIAARLDQRLRPAS